MNGVQSFFMRGKVTEIGKVNYTQANKPFMRVSVTVVKAYSNATGKKYVEEYHFKPQAWGKELTTLCTGLKVGDDILFMATIKTWKNDKGYENIDLEMTELHLINGREAIMPLDTSIEANLNEENPF